MSVNESIARTKAAEEDKREDADAASTASGAASASKKRSALIASTGDDLDPAPQKKSKGDAAAAASSPSAASAAEDDELAIEAAAAAAFSPRPPLCPAAAICSWSIAPAVAVKDDEARHWLDLVPWGYKCQVAITQRGIAGGVWCARIDVVRSECHVLQHALNFAVEGMQPGSVLDELQVSIKLPANTFASTGVMHYYLGPILDPREYFPLLDRLTPAEFADHLHHYDVLVAFSNSPHGRSLHAHLQLNNATLPALMQIRWAPIFRGNWEAAAKKLAEEVVWSDQSGLRDLIKKIERIPMDKLCSEIIPLWINDVDACFESREEIEKFLKKPAGQRSARECLDAIIKIMRAPRFSS